MRGRSLGETFGVRLGSSVQGDLPALDHHLMTPGMEVRGPQVPNARMVVDLVVPVEEAAAPGAGGLDRVEALGVGRPVLQGLEVAFDVRVVVGLTGQSGLGLVDKLLLRQVT